jgi:hypothetical protein
LCFFVFNGAQASIEGIFAYDAYDGRHHRAVVFLFLFDKCTQAFWLSRLHTAIH